MGSIPGLGEFLGGGHSNPLQYSCLKNPMGGGAWRAIVHSVAKRQTWLKELKWLCDSLPTSGKCPRYFPCLTQGSACIGTQHQGPAHQEREILFGLKGLGKGDFWEAFLYCYLQGEVSSWGRPVKQISPRWRVWKFGIVTHWRSLNYPVCSEHWRPPGLAQSSLPRLSLAGCWGLQHF